MEKFIGTILTIILVFYALRFLGRLILPWIISRFVNRMTRNFHNQMFSQSTFDNVAGEDESVQFGTKQPKQRKAPKLDGEYVDFEEIQ